LGKDNNFLKFKIEKSKFNKFEIRKEFVVEKLSEFFLKNNSLEKKLTPSFLFLKSKL